MLCQAIGARHFYTSAGLLPAEYSRAAKAWHEAFRAHELYPRYEANESGVHARILQDVGKPPEQRRLAIERTGEIYRDDSDQLPGSVYTQDGDDVAAAPGECLLELSLMGRYYGEGYERGDLLTYCAIAEWLEINVPGCVVLYGGDSSGVCAEPFDADRRMQLKRHLYSQSGRDYFNRGWMTEQGGPKPKACSRCPGGNYCGSQFGTGTSYAAFHCPGCGDSVETRDHGASWQKKAND